MEWLGLIELLVVLSFVLGWGLLELYTLKIDREKRERRARNAEKLQAEKRNEQA